MRTAVLALLSCTWLAIGSVIAADPVQRDDGKTIEKIRRLPASAVDGTQSAIPLEQWLLSALETAGPIDWEISDCDLKPDDSKPTRRCVTARSQPKPGGLGVRLHIFVDTVEGGAAAKPTVAPQSFLWKRPTKPSAEMDGRKCTLAAASLDELRRNAAVLKGKLECE